MLELKEKALETVSGGSRRRHRDSGNTYNIVNITLKNFEVEKGGKLIISVRF